MKKKIALVSLTFFAIVGIAFYAASLSDCLRDSDTKIENGYIYWEVWHKKDDSICDCDHDCSNQALEEIYVDIWTDPKGDDPLYTIYLAHTGTDGCWEEYTGFKILDTMTLLDPNERYTADYHHSGFEGFPYYCNEYTWFTTPE